MDAVLVVGESLIDIVRTPGGDIEEVIGGSPANVALGLARQQVPVAFHTALAHDDRGERIAAHLAAAGVDVAAASWSLPSTSSALAEIGADGAAQYTFDIAWPLPTAPDADGAALVHTGSIAAFLEPGAAVLEETLAAAGADALVTLDPNIRPALLPDRSVAVARFERLVALADVVKLSDEDAAWLYPDRPLADVAQAILDAGTRLVAVTRGGDGAILAAGGIVRSLAAPVVAVRDTVGAGDTFMAALIAQVLQTPTILSSPTEAELDRIARYAVTAAAITVQRVGADLPTSEEIAAALA